jgi:hypothetical protein
MSFNNLFGHCKPQTTPALSFFFVLAHVKEFIEGHGQMVTGGKNDKYPPVSTD